MIKNKAIKALLIGACITVSTMSGVYADTTDAPIVPAVTQQAENKDELMTIQITSAKAEDELTVKQKEIDQYIFEQHKQELKDKGINVTSTAVMGDFVEIAMAPFDTQGADYLYEIFGNDQILVVDGSQAVPLDMVTTTVLESTVEKEPSFFAGIFNSIVEWFKSIF